MHSNDLNKPLAMRGSIFLMTSLALSMHLRYLTSKAISSCSRVAKVDSSCVILHCIVEF